MGGPVNVIEAVELSKSFATARGTFQALASVSFSVRRGEMVGVFGPNGCGKSTLMNILAGLDVPDDPASLRRNVDPTKISFVFQDYRRSLLPWRGVLDNIAFPLELDGVAKAERHARAGSIMRDFGVTISTDSNVHELSGGQAQAVSILRGLVRRPELLILDEPFSALDFEATRRLQGRLLDYAEQHGLTVILISHELDEALYMSDRTLLFSKSPGCVAEVITSDLPRPRRPEHQTTDAFLKAKRLALSAFDKLVAS